MNADRLSSLDVESCFYRRILVVAVNVCAISGNRRISSVHRRYTSRLKCWMFKKRSSSALCVSQFSVTSSHCQLNNIEIWWRKGVANSNVEIAVRTFHRTSDETITLFVIINPCLIIQAFKAIDSFFLLSDAHLAIIKLMVCSFATWREEL